MSQATGETFYWSVEHPDGSLTYKCGECEEDLTGDLNYCHSCNLSITDDFKMTNIGCF